MHASAGQRGADGQLSVSHVEVELVASPVLILPLVVLLGAHVALPGQIAQHLFQRLMPLPLDARTALGSFGSAKRAWSTFGLRLPAGSLLLFSRLRETLARRDRSRIARNMTDQALALGSGNDRLMQLLGQFGGGEFGEGAGEFGFVGKGPRAAPAAELT